MKVLLTSMLRRRLFLFEESVEVGNWAFDTRDNEIMVREKGKMQIMSEMVWHVVN